MSGDMLGFVKRPISGTLVAFIALVVIIPLVRRLIRPRPSARSATVQAQPDGTEAEPEPVPAPNPANDA